MVSSHREGPDSEREVREFLKLPQTSSRNQKAQTLPQKIIKKTKDLIKRPRKASPIHLPSELIIKPVHSRHQHSEDSFNKSVMTLDEKQRLSELKQKYGIVGSIESNGPLSFDDQLLLNELRYGINKNQQPVQSSLSD